MIKKPDARIKESPHVNKNTSLPPKKHKKPGKHRVNAISHGGFAKDPLEVYKSWQKHNPANSNSVDNLYAGFSLFLGIIPKDPCEKDLKILAIWMVSRDLMLGISIQKDMTTPIRSHGKLVMLRQHHLMNPTAALDDKIQKRLKSLGLITQD